MRRTVQLTLLVVALSPHFALAATLRLADAMACPAGSVVRLPLRLDGTTTATALQADVVVRGGSAAFLGAEGGSALSGDLEVDAHAATPERLRLLVHSRAGLTVPDGDIAVILVRVAVPGAPTVLTLENVVGSAPRGATAADLELAGVTLTATGACVPGDVFPTAGGDGRTTLADWEAARRMLAGTIPTTPRLVACADIAPGIAACAPRGATQRWRAAPNGVFTSDDLRELRLEVAGLSFPDCSSCGPDDQVASPSPPPGDIAPRGAPNGVVSVADVVLALRFAVGLEAPVQREAARADVAPAAPSADTMIIIGNGRIDVADVVLILRATVGLASLRFPERSVSVLADEVPAGGAFTLTVSGWPLDAVVTGSDLGACAGTGEGFDVLPAAWALTCGAPALPVGSWLFTVRYRAPLAIDIPSLRVRSEVIDGSLLTVEAPLPLRTP